MKLFVILSVFLASFSLSAAIDKSFKAKVKSKVDAYYFMKSLPTSLQAATKHECDGNDPRQNSTACMNVICSQVSNHECDDMSEIRSHLQACRGNYGGDCILKVCGYLSNHDCDSPAELHQIARACENRTASCIDVICSQVSNHACDDNSEILAHLNVCQGVDSECVSTVCGYLSNHECDDVSEVYEVIRSCRIL